MKKRDAITNHIKVLFINLNDYPADSFIDKCKIARGMIDVFYGDNSLCTSSNLLARLNYLTTLQPAEWENSKGVVVGLFSGALSGAIVTLINNNWTWLNDTLNHIILLFEQGSPLSLVGMIFGFVIYCAVVFAIAKLSISIANVASRFDKGKIVEMDRYFTKDYEIKIITRMLNKKIKCALPHAK